MATSGFGHYNLLVSWAILVGLNSFHHPLEVKSKTIPPSLVGHKIASAKYVWICYIIIFCYQHTLFSVELCQMEAEPLQHSLSS